MLNKDVFHFLKALKESNNREWFAANKSWYEKSRKNVESTVAQLIASIASFDSNIGHLDAKRCIFRIYRDTRFSPDKTPYKTHFGAVFTPPGLGKSSGYYLHIDPEGSFLTCGHYMLEPAQLKAIRKGIYEDYETFRAILDEKKMKQEIGDLFRDENALQRVPNGFDKDHPAAEYMKLKHFYVLKEVQETELFSENFIEYATGIYQIMQPLNDFLNALLV